MPSILSARLSSARRALAAGGAAVAIGALALAPAAAQSVPAADPLWDFLVVPQPYVAAPATPSQVAELAFRPLVPAAETAATATPAPAVQPKPVPSTYTVVAGDTLREIGDRHGLTVETLLGANPQLGGNPDRLHPGHVLTLLPSNGVLVTLAEGDTLVKVAQRFHVDPVGVASYNQIQDADHLPAGTQLILAGAHPESVSKGGSTPVAHDHDPAGEGEQTMAMLPLVVPGAAFSAVWPASGKITTHFGEVGPTSPRGHAGLDIAAPVGTPIYAAAAGTVYKAGWNNGGYGNLVILEHEGGIDTWYAHLSSFAVEAGEKVAKGQLLGGMGSTGYSTGSHLHFEVREGGELKNPMRYLP